MWERLEILAYLWQLSIKGSGCGWPNVALFLKGYWDTPQAFVPLLGWCEGGEKLCWGRSGLLPLMWLLKVSNHLSVRDSLWWKRLEFRKTLGWGSIELVLVLTFSCIDFADLGLIHQCLWILIFHTWIMGGAHSCTYMHLMGESVSHTKRCLTNHGHLLQPGRAETRTCPMTPGCRKLCPRDCPCKHAEGTYLWQTVLSGRRCSLLCFTACSCIHPPGNKTRCFWSTAKP